SCSSKRPMTLFFFFSSRRRHTSFSRDWSSDVCSSDLVCRYREEGLHLLLKTGEQLGDYLALAPEVVVEITRRNAHVAGNVVGGDIALTLFIEQLQACLQDAVAGIGSAGHWSLFCVESRRGGHGGSGAYSSSGSIRAKSGVNWSISVSSWKNFCGSLSMRMAPDCIASGKLVRCSRIASRVLRARRMLASACSACRSGSQVRVAFSRLTRKRSSVSVKCQFSTRCCPSARGPLSRTPSRSKNMPVPSARSRSAARAADSWPGPPSRSSSAPDR